MSVLAILKFIPLTLVANGQKAESSQESEDETDVDCDYSESSNEENSTSALKRKKSDSVHSNSQIDFSKDKEIRIIKRVKLKR